MAFEFICFTLFGLLVGTAFAFAGYSLFRSILPLIGFFFGFALGAQTMHYLFGIGFLAMMSSWIVGAIVGILFAVLSYMFFKFAIAIVAGSLGYGVGVSILLWVGLEPGFIPWLVGIILGVAMIFATFKFRLEKLVIVFDTALFGAAIIVNSLISTGGNTTPTGIEENPIRAMLQGSPLWGIFFLVILVGGIIFQLKSQTFSVWTEPPLTDSIPGYDPLKHDRLM